MLIKKYWKLILLFIGLFLIWFFTVNMWSPTKKIRFQMDVNYSVSDPQFQSTISSFLGPPLVDGNEITPLLNGDQIFPSMLDAIAQAKTSITFETYIYWTGTVGQKFTTALSERSKNGVSVSVLLDWLGSRNFDPNLLKQLKDSGVQLYFYHPVRWYDLDRLNNRTHRRLLVVDGKVGFVGSVGIADEWLGNGLQPELWRDSHYKIVGPVVAQIQAGFIDNWIRTQEQVLQGEKYFPNLAIEQDGKMRAQLFKSSAEEGATSARLLFLYSILAARKTIDIENAYFLPDAQFIEELLRAVKRGVRVRILVPSEKTDSQLTLKASHANWGELLEGGIQMWTYTPAKLHNKLMVVDSLWTSVGSINFDPRSFRLNKEANLNVLDSGFAMQQIAQFENDLAVSKAVQLSEWQARPWLERWSDFLLLAIKPQL